MALQLWLLAGRALCFIFAATTFALIIKAPNINRFSGFEYLAVASCIQMAWSAIRLFFDVASQYFGGAQPSNTTLIALNGLEMVLAIATTTAGSSALGVAVLLDLDLRDCDELPPSACAMYLTSSALAVVVGIIGLLITAWMQWMLSMSIRHNFNTIST